MLPESDDQEGIAGGLCYCVSAGVNLQVFVFFFFYCKRCYLFTSSESHPLFVDSFLSCI